VPIPRRLWLIRPGRRDRPLRLGLRRRELSRERGFPSASRLPIARHLHGHATGGGPGGLYRRAGLHRPDRLLRSLRRGGQPHAHHRVLSGHRRPERLGLLALAAALPRLSSPHCPPGRPHPHRFPLPLQTLGEGKRHHRDRAFAAGPARATSRRTLPRAQPRPAPKPPLHSLHGGGQAAPCRPRRRCSTDPLQRPARPACTSSWLLPRHHPGHRRGGQSLSASPREIYDRPPLTRAE
jgi:hypothetical protein